MIVPLTAAQASASRISTSGEAGLAGGGLPVAAFQDVFRALRAAVAATSAATSEKMPQTFELSLWPESLLIVASRFGGDQPTCPFGAPPCGGRRPASARAAASWRGCRDEISQYGVGSRGSCRVTLTDREM